MLITNRLIKIHHVIDWVIGSGNVNLLISMIHICRTKKRNTVQTKLARQKYPFCSTSLPVFAAHQKAWPLRLRELTEPQALEGYRKKYRGFR